jgi:hypothetical protein
MAINSSIPIWHYQGEGQRPYLADPRTPIARHIQWSKPIYGKEGRGLTDWSVPEPDAFNSALFASKPIECPFIRNQVWYYDENRRAWFSVYFVEKDQKAEWSRWAMKQNWIAQWTVFKPSQLRKPRPMLEEKKRKKATYEPSLNERLHELNYYSTLLNKVEEDMKPSVLQRIGDLTDNSAVLRDF